MSHLYKSRHVLTNANIEGNKALLYTVELTIGVAVTSICIVDGM
jgi:hypothetical protein